MLSANERGGPRAPWNWSDAAIVLLFLAITAVCYGNVLNNSFVYDDGQQILQNPYVKSWHFLPQIFGTTVWSFVGQAGTTNYYRPLMTFTFLVLWQVFGPIPFGFHLFSLVLQFAVVAMVFYAGRRLFNDARIAFFAALLFSVHPIHTEVVDWIAAVPDLEAALFLLTALWFYAGDDDRSWKSAVATYVFFALALLCKEPALMFVVLAVAFEFGVRTESAKGSLAKKFWRWLPMALTGVAYLGLRIILFGKLAPVLQRPRLTWPEAIYSAFALVASYTKLLFWPWPLSAFHVFQPFHSSSDPQVLAGMAICLFCVGTVLFLAKFSPSAAFAVLWIAVTLGPVLNPRWMASNVLAERYLYLPSIGFCWLIAWLGVRAWEWAPDFGLPKYWLRAALATVGSAVLILAILTNIRRNADWETDLSLYSRTLETDPRADIIRSNLAGVYYDNGDQKLAEKEWDLALAGKPDSVNTMNALAILYTGQQRYNEARSMLERAILAKPGWTEPHYNLGVLLHKMGDDAGSLAELEKAVELAPVNPLARRYYGDELAAVSRTAEAEVQYLASAKLDPRPETLFQLAVLYSDNGRPQDAEPLLRKVLKNSPYDSEAHLRLGSILESRNEITQATREYREVLTMDPANKDAKQALLRIHAGN